MKKLILVVALSLFASFAKSEEKICPEGFVSLFNGKDVENWNSWGASPLSHWKVQDGVIRSIPLPFDKDKGLPIISNTKVKDCIVLVDFRMGPNPKLNSGVMVGQGVQTDISLMNQLNKK